MVDDLPQGCKQILLCVLSKFHEQSPEVIAKRAILSDGIAEEVVNRGGAGAREMVIGQASEEGVPLQQVAPQPFDLVIAHYLSISSVQLAALSDVVRIELDGDADVEWGTSVLDEPVRLSREGQLSLWTERAESKRTRKSLAAI
jgi:hypothetical protein